MRRLRLIITLAAIATFLSPVPYSHASNPACSPTISASAVLGYNEAIFTSVGTCDWNMTGISTILNLDMLGGGGGGGAGSWNGSSTGGGGGGGGAGGNFSATNISVTPGSSVTITVGAGGSAGTGASSSGTLGIAGGTGGSSSFGSYTIPGGVGGGRGSGDTGGDGGASGGQNTTGTFSNGYAGGTHYSYNGGGGGLFNQVGNSAYSNLAGSENQIGAVPSQTRWKRFFNSAGGASYNDGIWVLAPGGGGTSYNYGGAGQPNGGSTSNTPGDGRSNMGDGGGGGRGCPTSFSSCVNNAGSAGGSGRVEILFAWAVTAKASSLSFQLGQVSSGFLSQTTPGINGNLFYITSGNTLPSGLSLNSATGEISGTPTATMASTLFTFNVQDQYSYDSISTYITVTKALQTGLALTGGTLYNGDTGTLTATGGLGTGTLSYSTSNSSICQLGGTNNSLLTAKAGSGSCVITATKAGDSNYESGTATATFTLHKKSTGVTFSSSLNSPQPTNTAITLSATIPTAATGTITFTSNGSAISNCGTSGVVTVVSGSASCVWTPSSTTGTPFSLVASYSGDATYAVDSSTISNYAIYSPISLSYSNLSLALSAGGSASPTVSGGSGSYSGWTWSISKTSDASSVSGITISGGVVTVDASTAAGTYPMTVSTTDGAGTTQTATITITIARIAINLSYTDTSTTFGTAITIPVSVSGGFGSPSTWTWTMVKASDSSTVYQMSISGGVITVSNTTPGGTYAMVVSATDGAGTVKTAPITITVTKVYGTVTIRAANSSGTTVTGVTVNRQIQLMGSTGVGGGGTMVFYANGTAVCSFVSIYSGTGSCWWGVSDTSTASFNIYAVYSGDSSVYGGTSNTLTNFPVNAAIHVTYNDIHVSSGYSSTSAPTATGGTGAPNTWTWSMSQHFTGQQISGITINSSTGVVSVASNTANGTYAMDIYPTDPTNANTVATITIYVANQSTPNIVLWTNGETVTAGSPITGYFLLSIGGSIDTFTISPAAPAGMTFNTNTGVFSGSPTIGQSATTYTITGFNSMGSASATYVLVVTANNSGTTITIALSGGGTTAYMRTAVGIVATASQDGKVTFYWSNKAIPGCKGISTSSKSVTCSWKPSARGSAVLYAALKPNSGSYTSSRSANLNVGVGSRSGTR